MSSPARRTAGLMIACIGVACALSPTAVVAQGRAARDREQASRHFDSGLELIVKGAYSDAVVQFERAYELSGDAAVLHNLGMAYAAAARPVEAASALARYLEQSGDALSGPEQKRVEAELERQRARFGHVAIQIDPAGALIKVDGRLAGIAPLAAPLPLPVGEHRIEATYHGHQSASVAVTVASERQTMLLVALRPVLPASATPAARPVALLPPLPIPRAQAAPGTAHDGGRTQRVAGYALGATGIAAGIAAVTVGLISADRFDDWEREDAALEPVRAATDPDTERRKKENDALLKSIWQMDALTWALGIGGGALLAGGAVMLWTADESDG
ncbi:MAG TPA: PEGA domain-containing protein, partial [Polyangiales bacterium]|nr:PEGA domain-containing protein [Polyangiales bacterium]